MKIILIDLLWITIAAAGAYGGIRIWRSPRFKDAKEVIWSRRRVRIAFYVILVYLFVGLLSRIQIPGNDVRTLDLLDLVFFSTPVERTYSAPLADQVTGIRIVPAEAEMNRVKGIHLLGTDINGNDLLKQVLKGAGTALTLALGTSAVALPLGVLLGILAGWFGGIVDDLIQWLMSTVASIPWLLFVIAFLMVFGRGMIWICLAIGLTSWVGTSRMIRGETLKQKSLDYVTAARAAGISTAGILVRHILPNVRYLIIIDFTLSASAVILAETVLTFIGIGVEPGTASWGIMLVEAEKELMRSPPIWWVFAGSAFVGIFPLVLSLNVFGDALRDALDPRTASMRK
jgi:peptide/nickel transport system permease protein